MKTAKEWVNTRSTIKGVLGNLTIDVVRQIQLDAWKQGMTDAESIVAQHHSHTSQPMLNILKVRDAKKNVEK